jgi:hypothetical protein
VRGRIDLRGNCDPGRVPYVTSRDSEMLYTPPLNAKRGYRLRFVRQSRHVDEGCEDHAAEALRYALMSHPPAKNARMFVRYVWVWLERFWAWADIALNPNGGWFVYAWRRALAWFYGKRGKG